MGETINASGWAEIIRATGGAIRDIILAFGVLWGAWSSATNSGKLDVVGEKADIAAIESKAAAMKAAVVEKTTDAIAAINLGYEYRRTEKPEDKAKADVAQAKVMLQAKAAPDQ